MTVELSFDSAFTRLRKVVYKRRLRLKEFLQDFDGLRTGYMHANHFLSGLSMAGMDRELSPKELQLIADAYTVEKTPTLKMVEYRSFLNDVDIIFTLPELEKTPLADVPAEPSELLDRTRYQKASRVLSDEREEIYAQLIAAMQEKVEKRGVSVKPFFDDAANNPNSMKLYGHVTTFQFKQVLNTSLHWSVSDEEADILVEKFRHEDKLEFVNYVAFSNTVDSPDNEWNRARRGGN